MTTRRSILFLTCLGTGCDCGDDDRRTTPTEDAAAGDAGVDAALPDCGPVESGTISDTRDLTEGDTIAGPGDFFLRSDRITLVVDDAGDPDHIAASGGTLLELGVAGSSYDHLNQVSQLFTGRQGATIDYDAVGAENAGTIARIVATGEVHGRAGFPAVTTYELRTCEPFVRITTEVTNDSGEDLDLPIGELGPLTLDVIFWGTRSLRPFCPGSSGEGFSCPEFDISNPIASTGGYPFVAAYARSGPPFSLAIFSPSEGEVFGVNDEQVSALGPPSAVAATLPAGETVRYERRIAISDARSDVAASADIAMDALRADLEVGNACLDVTLPDGADGARIEIFEPYGPEPDDLDRRIPWTDLAPQASGEIEARVPAGEHRILVTPTSGEPLLAGSVTVTAGARSDCVPVAVPALSTVAVEVVDPAGAGVPARLVVVGTGETISPANDVHGASPAGNMWLTDLQGRADLRLGDGTYEVYAVRGIRHSLARASISVPLDDAVTLEIAPVGTLGASSTAADLHVHSALSFDSSLPLDDRVISYVAAGVDVVVASEHDVIGDYGPTIERLAVGERIVGIAGLEATASVPYEAFPHTTGHHNVWPLVPDPGARRSGAPADEFLPIGDLYATLRALPAPGGVDKVVQLNHARSSTAGTIWLGWFDACGFDPGADLSADDPCAVLGADGTFDLMEIANGESLLHARGMRADWLSIVAQRGHVTAVANSDSHRLGEVAGFPQNLVEGVFDAAAFDVEAFDAALVAGRVYGSSGPILRARIGSAGPGDVLAIDPADASLDFTVEAAPWVPVAECRIVVDGEVVETAPGAAVADPFDAATDPVRCEGPVDLAPYLGSADAFVVLEAGIAWPADDVEPVTGGPYGVVAPGHDPLAFSNPIYLDLDGGGWSPPGT